MIVPSVVTEDVGFSVSSFAANYYHYYAARAILTKILLAFIFVNSTF